MESANFTDYQALPKPKVSNKAKAHADIDVERFVAICQVSQSCLWKLGLSFVVKINFYF